MYTKWLYTKCIPHFDKLLYTFCIHFVYIQNVYKMFLYKMCPTFPQTFVYKMYIYKMFVYKIYTTIRQIFVYILYTKFNWHTSFDFVYKCIQKFVEMWYTFCIHQLHTSCTIFVYKMSTQFLCGIFPILDRNILIPYRMFLSIIWIVGTIKNGYITVVS